MKTEENVLDQEAVSIHPLRKMLNYVAVYSFWSLHKLVSFLLFICICFTVVLGQTKVWLEHGKADLRQNFLGNNPDEYGKPLLWFDAFYENVCSAIKSFWSKAGKRVASIRKK